MIVHTFAVNHHILAASPYRSLTAQAESIVVDNIRLFPAYPSPGYRRARDEPFLEHGGLEVISMPPSINYMVHEPLSVRALSDEPIKIKPFDIYHCDVTVSLTHMLNVLARNIGENLKLSI